MAWASLPLQRSSLGREVVFYAFGAGLLLRGLFELFEGGAVGSMLLARLNAEMPLHQQQGLLVLLLRMLEILEEGVCP